MTAYCIWDVREVHDQQTMAEYVARVVETVTAFGGEYVVVGGPWQVVEGDWRPSHPVVIVFPSLERAHEWYTSELYAPLREMRLGATVCDAVFLEGVATITSSRAAAATLGDVAIDLYRDVHKGIRSGLFRAVELAGSVDPLDPTALAESHARLGRLLDLLDLHAAHEDEYLGPVVERHLPALAVQLEREHAELDSLTAELRRQMAVLAGEGPIGSDADRRLHQHRLYLTLAEFAGAYLRHQTTEEASVLPALNRLAGPDELLEANGALVASIEPDAMEAYLRLIVSAANALDLSELSAGMRDGAPAEAFAALLDIPRDGLTPEAWERLSNDLVPA